VDNWQHEINMAADEGIRQLIEQSDGDVPPAQKTAAMKSTMDKRCILLRQKMGKNLSWLQIQSSMMVGLMR
jgi:hypothetical protein